MSDQDPYRMFFQSEDQESDAKWLTAGSSGSNNNYDIPLVISHDPPSFWHSPPFSGIVNSLQKSHETGDAADHYSNVLINDLSGTFDKEAPFSLPAQQENPGENGLTENYIPLISDHHQPLFRSISTQEMTQNTNYNYMQSTDDHRSTFGVTNNPSSLPNLQQTNNNPRELTPCSKEIILHGLADEGQSSGTKRKQTQETELQEDGAKQERKQRKRGHNYVQLHNQNNRRHMSCLSLSSVHRNGRSFFMWKILELRRRKFAEKLKALQELIPRCNKRDKESTLDHAIKYIKSLQYRVQVQEQQMGSTSTGKCFPMPYFPWMMPAQPGMQQTPTLPQFFHPFPAPEYGMGMSYPMDQMGLSHPCNNNSLASTSSANAMEPRSQFTTQEDTNPSESGHNQLT